MMNKKESISMTASAHDYEEDAVTEEQATAIEWWEVPENREYAMQAIRAAAEAACDAVRAICRMISAAADLVKEVYIKETEEGTQHDRIE